MSRRYIYRLEIIGKNGNEVREFEARNLSQAIKNKDLLLQGREYFSLTQVCEVRR